MASSTKKDAELLELQRAMLSSPSVGAPHAVGDPDVRSAFVQRRSDQRAAYGQFVATADIYEPEGSTLVFTSGSAVPVEHVEKWDLEAVGMVERVASEQDARRGVRASIGPAAILATDDQSVGKSTSDKK